MAATIEARLKELGIVLPMPAKPVANYVPYTIAGSLVAISGQVPMKDGALAFTGSLGGPLTLEQGRQAARLCAINLLAQLRDACAGDLDRVRRCLRLGVFVSSASGFTDQPQVANGASDLMVEVFGERGRHARTAIGTNVLPLDCAVEVDGLFEIA